MIRFAEKFGDEAEGAVADQENAGYRAARSRSTAEKPENREQRQAFQPDMVKLRRMTRLHVAGLRENHHPRQAGVGDPAPQFAIDEIADPPGGQSERHQRGDEVGDVEPGDPVLARPQTHGGEDAEEATVKRHATLPDGKDLQRVSQVVAGLVEQHLPQAAADDHAEHAVEQQVVQLPDREQAGARANAVTPEDDKLNESDQIHQTVPAHRQRAEREGDGVELGVQKHWRRRVG